MKIPETWYVGAQNDILYILNRPPRPSTDDIAPVQDVTVIAKVYAAEEGHAVETARARLLASAPDLLAAAKMALLPLKEAWSRQTEGPDLWPIFEAVRLAIARAEKGD